VALESAAPGAGAGLVPTPCAFFCHDFDYGEHALRVLSDDTVQPHVKAEDSSELDVPLPPAEVEAPTARTEVGEGAGVAAALAAEDPTQEAAWNMFYTKNEGRRVPSPQPAIGQG
jgi:hypothetical protein